MFWFYTPDVDKMFLFLLVLLKQKCILYLYFLFTLFWRHFIRLCIWSHFWLMLQKSQFVGAVTFFWEPFRKSLNLSYFFIRFTNKFHLLELLEIKRWWFFLFSNNWFGFFTISASPACVRIFDIWMLLWNVFQCTMCSEKNMMLNIWVIFL